MISWLEKRVKRMDLGDVILTKFSVAAFAFFIITVWPAAMTWVHSVNTWYFLAVAIILALRPWYRVYIK